ncbi:hypothetical protein Pcinc_003438 [Petrolisthes cinctipes]|uniref:Uncharacterized protein n=1 Tax=Petrolisthes cinctipes TaxID=88211 RepID=A0AAE1L223_PETCI|nr:hypothetical protein Pcinc_003438 [Petrolisthes cinctipes]
MVSEMRWSYQQCLRSTTAADTAEDRTEHHARLRIVCADFRTTVTVLPVRFSVVQPFRLAGNGEFKRQ